jgi:hypothetical protein
MEDKKGQGMNIIPAVILLMLVGFVGIVSITVYDSIESSLASGLSSTTSDAYYTHSNFSGEVFDGYTLASNIPIVLAAGLLIMVILGFGLYIRG